jgi:hypothetical protein
VKTSSATRWTRLRELARRAWAWDSPGPAITTMMVLGGIAAAGGWPYYDDMMKAFDTYLRSVYFVLRIAFP